MLDIKQRALEVAKEIFEALNYDINELPKIEVFLNEKIAALEVRIGVHLDNNLCGDMLHRKFDYCILDKEGKVVQTMVRFSTICNILNSAIDDFSNVMDDMVNNLQEVMKEYFDEKFKPSNKSTTIEV